jgi:hypothetical protein
MSGESKATSTERLVLTHQMVPDVIAARIIEFYGHIDAAWIFEKLREQLGTHDMLLGPDVFDAQAKAGMF